MTAFRAGLRARIRELVLRLRMYRVSELTPMDPSSPEYLYLVQQCKRVSLSRTLGRLSLWNAPLWPLILAIVVFKWADLVLANALIRSLINERDLLRQSKDERGR